MVGLAAGGSARVVAAVLEEVEVLEEEEEEELVVAMDLDLELVEDLAPGTEEVSVEEAGSVEEEVAVAVSVGGLGKGEGLAPAVDSEEEEALGVGVVSEAVVEEAAEWEEGPGMEVGTALVWAWVAVPVVVLAVEVGSEEAAEEVLEEGQATVEDLVLEVEQELGVA